ncbi:putative ABC transporter [Ixodes scapularis]
MVRNKASKTKVQHALSKLELGGLEPVSQNKPLCDKLYPETCKSGQPYRSLDGSCNNLGQPAWGRALGCHARIAPAAFGDVLARSLGSVLLAVAMRQLSHLLHSEMISAVLSSPIAFFEATPRGRIANRFLVDLDLMDSRLYLSGKQFTQHTLFAISRLIIIGTQSPFVLAVGVASSVLLIFLVRLAVRASHPPKFREAVHTSRILSHVTETMDSLSSVRAYGVLDRFSYHFCRLVDVNIRAYSAFCGLFRYVRLVTFLCGLVTMVCTMLFAVLPSPEDSQPDPSILGLTISAASLLLQTLSFLNLMMFFSLQAVVGFERCIEYTELPPEVSYEMTE